jgi:hypothetical protein
MPASSSSHSALAHKEHEQEKQNQKEHVPEKISHKEPEQLLYTPGTVIPVTTTLAALIPAMFNLSANLLPANLTCTTIDGVSLIFGFGPTTPTSVIYAYFNWRPVAPNTILVS